MIGRRDGDAGIRVPHKCPECDLGGEYDGGKVRMVEVVGPGSLGGAMIPMAREPAVVKVVCCLVM